MTPIYANHVLKNNGIGHLGNIREFFTTVRIDFRHTKRLNLHNFAYLQSISVLSVSFLSLLHTN